MKSPQEMLLRSGLVIGLAIGASACSITIDSSPSAVKPTSHELTFDALGGGSNVIKVYPGALNTPVDEKYDGTFESGQTAAVVCETIGRIVTSDTLAGEEYRQSAKWYEIQAGGSNYFATATYADVTGGPVRQCS
ncbi:MAG TPA: hypothetical protein VIH90_04375 [Candidatus Saccharimonadales bacterium]